MYGMSRCARPLLPRVGAPGPGLPGDVVRDHVDRITAQHTFEANISTVRTADDVLGVLLNITV